VLGERLSRLEPELGADQRVVSDLRMGVEREVVAGKRDVRVEQRLQALLHRLAHHARMEVPEQAVMAEHELGAIRRGPLEQLPLCRHARHDQRDLLCAGHLQPVRSVVSEGVDLEQLVEVGDDLVAARHGGPDDIPRG
jgi:hypothetical protein